MKKIMLLILGISLSTTIFAQNNVVYGKVSIFDNLTLSGIRVIAKNAGTQAITDSMGNYSIVCNDKDVLIFDSKAFTKIRKRVKPTTDSINVKMHFLDIPDNVELAVGYGYISKEKATHAYSMLTNDDVDFCSYTDIFDLISGRCPGVRVEKTSSLPGSESEIIIRGKNSIMLSNCALYVVDGVTTDYIGSISPCDVKSINFLKDASASIYGSRGANGVVMIETVGGLE